MWFGNKSKFLYKKNFLKNKKNKIVIRKAWVFFKKSNNHTFNLIRLYLPNFSKFFVFRNTKLNLISVYVYFNIYIYRFFMKLKKRSQISIDPQLNILFFFNIPFDSFFKIFFNRLISIFFSFFRLLFFKIKFKGKGYYIFKNFRNTVTTRFGFAHRTYFYFFNIKTVFLNKTSFLFIGLDWQDIKKSSYNFFNLRPFNVFTGRGVRFSKHKLFKKKGKIGY